MEQNSNEMINVEKREYEYIKQISDNYFKLLKCDFLLKIKKGLIVPKEHPNYYNGRVDIEIYNESSYSIQIEGKNYSIDSILFSEIKNTIENYVEKLIYFSKLETQQYLMENAYEGGSPSSIILKYGQLIINLNGQVFGEISDLCNEIKDKIVNLILNNSLSNEKVEDNNIVMELIKKVEELPFDKEITIAELINYNPEEENIEPLLQGETYNKLMETCKQKNINILEIEGGFAGLAYYYKFKKVNSNNIEEIKMERGNEMNDEFKIKNNIQFEDEETRIEYQKYLDEINEYNRKIKNGEETDANPADLLNKYREKFYDEELENKMKKIDNQKENINFENNETDELLNKINQRISELDEEYKD